MLTNGGGGGSLTFFCFLTDSLIPHASCFFEHTVFLYIYSFYRLAKRFRSFSGVPRSLRNVPEGFVKFMLLFGTFRRGRNVYCFFRRQRKLLPAASFNESLRLNQIILKRIVRIHWINYREKLPELFSEHIECAPVVHGPYFEIQLSGS